MKLDKNYFNSLTLVPVKGRYYYTEDVDNTLVEIRVNALEMAEENETLLRQAEESRKKLNELETENRVLRDLLVRSQDKLGQAEERLDALEKKQSEREDFLVNKIAESVTQMKADNRGLTNDINMKWQKFLTELTEEQAPADLSDRVRRIAAEMQSISDFAAPSPVVEEKPEIRTEEKPEEKTDEKDMWWKNL